jgi:hypothetical protein
MLDSAQHSRQILNDRFLAFAGVSDNQRPRRDRIGEISPAGGRVFLRGLILWHLLVPSNFHALASLRTSHALRAATSSQIKASPPTPQRPGAWLRVPAHH